MKNLKFLFIAALLFNISFSAELSKTVKKEYSSKNYSSIKIENLNGNIILNSNKESKIKIIATKYVKGSKNFSLKKYLEQIKIDIKNNGEELSITPSFPKKESKIFSDNSLHFAIDFEISVPEKFNLDIQTTNGGIDLKNISGIIKAKSINGNLCAINLSGRLNISTVNGSIKGFIDNTLSTNKVNLKTVNGKIELKLNKNACCEISAKSVNGIISSFFPLKTNKRKSRAWGTINKGGFPLNLTSINGIIKIMKL